MTRDEVTLYYIYIFYLQIDVIPEVVRAVAGRCEVYLDGGVRLGTDVLKALALGARVVFIGRPAVYALAYNVISIYPAVFPFALMPVPIGSTRIIEYEFENIISKSVYFCL